MNYTSKTIEYRNGTIKEKTFTEMKVQLLFENSEFVSISGRDTITVNFYNNTFFETNTTGTYEEPVRILNRYLAYSTLPR